MSLFNNEKFTIYRDTDLEAFYEIDLKNRRKIILAHVIILLFPVVIAFFFTQIYSFGSFGFWLIIFSLLLYAIAIVETSSYLFPKSRVFYKKYFLWIIIPVSFLISLGGYFAVIDLIEIAHNRDEMRATILKILAGGGGVFSLFMISQFGLSQILYASKSLYTKKAKVEADIQFATEIQERILKEISIDQNELKAYACSYPANELGGDYFELSLQDDQLFASIGDISGHSFGAGLLMTLTKSALQTHLVYNQDPARVMDALNTMLNQQTGRAMYATMVLLKLDITNRIATLCNAGHLPVLHIPAESGEAIHRYKRGMGLGLTVAVSYNNLEFSVKKGDLLILYSDGLVETRDENMQIRDAGFFESIVCETIKETNLDSPAVLAAEILKKVRATDHSNKMEDDSSLITITV